MKTRPWQLSRRRRKLFFVFDFEFETVSIELSVGVCRCLCSRTPGYQVIVGCQSVGGGILPGLRTTPFVGQ